MARILVAEDDDPLRGLLGTLLRSKGHDVVVTRDGAEALAAAERGLFDLLITDYVMPVMDGAELIVALSAQRPHLPVIVYSAYRPDDRLQMLVDAGQTTYVLKGDRPGLLLDCVDHVLAGRATAQLTG